MEISKRKKYTYFEEVKKKSRVSRMGQNKYWRSRYLILLILPGLLYFIIFRYAPMYGLLMAFKDYSLKLGVAKSPWVGFKHFEQLFSGVEFSTVIKNTVSISFLKIIFGFSSPVILALMFNELKDGAFKRVSQTISYLPHFFSWVVLSGMIIFTLSPSTGTVNKVIEFFGGKPIYFLTNRSWFVPILIITDIWKEIGWGSIIYLAALAGLNSEILEASMIDGASRIQRIFYINLPGIASTIAVMLILRMGSILDAGFDQIFNLRNTAVTDISEIIDTYIYRMGIGSYKYDFSTAASMFKSAIGLIMVVFTNFISKKISDGENGIF